MRLLISMAIMALALACAHEKAVDTGEGTKILARAEKSVVIPDAGMQPSQEQVAAIIKKFDRDKSEQQLKAILSQCTSYPEDKFFCYAKDTAEGALVMGAAYNPRSKDSAAMMMKYTREVIKPACAIVKRLGMVHLIAVLRVDTMLATYMDCSGTWRTHEKIKPKKRERRLSASTSGETAVSLLI